MKEDQPAPHDSNTFDSAEFQTSNERFRLDAEKKKSQTSGTANPKLRCSQCGKAYLRSESKCLPFCSVRCQQIDLGNWLGESYGLPIEGHEEREYGTIDESEDGDDEQ